MGTLCNWNNYVYQWFDILELNGAFPVGGVVFYVSPPEGRWDGGGACLASSVWTLLMLVTVRLSYCFLLWKICLWIYEYCGYFVHFCFLEFSVFFLLHFLLHFCRHWEIGLNKSISTEALSLAVVIIYTNVYYVHVHHIFNLRDNVLHISRS